MKVLCYHCHINWWHKHPLEAARWFENKFPERAEYLEKTMRTNAGHKFTIMELETLTESLNWQFNEIKRLKGVE